MEAPPFPIAAADIGAVEPKRAIDAFLQNRPSQRWVLLGEHVVQSHLQLWTAWIQATRNEMRTSMVARSIDAEFLRYLAGTHHISEAFARAGVQEGQTSVLVVELPIAEGVANDLGHLQPKALPVPDFESRFSTVANELGWAAKPYTENPSIEGKAKLGIDIEGWSDARLDESSIAHILMADDQSSAHR
jgi:hypothetical protein